jgi:DNA-binding ferritin-like protein (Dps family)
MTTFIEKIVGGLDDKRRWRQYKARVGALPAPYRSTVEALERYLTYSGAVTDGDALMSMLDDLAGRFEHAATDRTPLRTVVGDDPAVFAKALLRQHTDRHPVNRERQRLVDAIAQAEANDARAGS